LLIHTFFYLIRCIGVIINGLKGVGMIGVCDNGPDKGVDRKGFTDGPNGGMAKGLIGGKKGEG